MTGNSFYSVEADADARSGGTTQAETRIYNERLIISLIRRKKQLSKVELTRLTGLSAQTITTIVNRAADNGLLIRQEPIRGRLGQPSVPYALNPDGVYSFGLKIDRRSADVALINFVGEVIAFERTTFAYPTPTGIMEFGRAAIGRILEKHPKSVAQRVAGLGIASPFQLWNWTEEIGAPPGGLNAWRQIDIREELDKDFDWPVYLFNDAMVSAAAELMFGAGSERADFLYAHIGYFIGGGLVLDHHLFPGKHKRAASIGDILVPSAHSGSRNDRGQPLMVTASLYSLVRKLEHKGIDAGEVWGSPESWGDFGPALDEWIEDVSDGLAFAISGAVALVDFDNAIIDGAIPAEVRRSIVKSTRMKLAALMVNRNQPFAVHEGAYGHLGPAIGGATIPLLVNYSNDKEILFKE